MTSEPAEGDTNPAAVLQSRATIVRSADQWFLDAGVYARDGDTASARAAALRGLDALGVPQ